MATRAKIQGAFTLSPPSATSGPSSTFPFSIQGVYSYDDCHAFAGAQSDAAVPLGPITRVKALAGYADQPIDLKLTSTNGATQIVPLQGMFLWQSDSRPITAIALNGTAVGKIFIAGD